MPETKMIVKTIAISKELDEWLEAHQSVNFSGLMRELLQKYIAEHDGE